MDEQPGFNVKAAIPLTDPYAKLCLQSFDGSATPIDYDALLMISEPVDFSKESKTAFLVMRLSCIFVDDARKRVGVVHRGDAHQQNAQMESVLVSSELIQAYDCVKVSNGLVINKYHPFTRKLGAYLGLFDIERKRLLACLRRQRDVKTGGMRYYVFFVHVAYLAEAAMLPTKISLQGNVVGDVMQFWSVAEAKRRVSDTLDVDKLALAHLIGEDYSATDVFMRPPVVLTGGNLRMSPAIVIIADEWGYTRGGINAFNCDIVSMMAPAARQAGLSVCCIVSPVSDIHRKSVAGSGVTLVSIEANAFDEPGLAIPQCEEALAAAGIIPSLVIGHDVKTGAIAVGLAKLAGVKSVVIHHMDYSSYASQKSARDGVDAHKKEENQRQLMASADFVIAVGPLLGESARRLVGAERAARVAEVVPGLNALRSGRGAEGRFEVLAFGRLTAGDDVIKQGSLVASAFGTFAKEPAVAAGSMLRFFGLSKNDYSAENAQVIQLAETAAGRRLTINCVPYTDDRSVVRNALEGASVVVMPSFREGFGLVAWEAIGAGVPVIISKASGVYRLLTKLGLQGGVLGLDVRGSDGVGGPREEDQVDLAHLLQEVWREPEPSITRARVLRDNLREFTWSKAAMDVLQNCGICGVR